MTLSPTIFLSKEKKSDYIFVSAPENVAWILNIRGGDSPNSPVPNARLIISKTKKLLLIINLEFGIGLFGLSLPLIFNIQATFSGALIKI